MRRLLFLVVFLQYLVSANAQSIIVNSASDPESGFGAEQLLTDVLLDGGSCSSATNFQLKDNPSAPFPSPDRSWGYFKKGNSNFPFEEGIVLTSGYAIDAQGPDSGNMSKGDYGWTGDPQTTYLAGINTNNATVFEFDFVPQGSEITFNYIFASEEYPTYACSNYNDVFGFIISGPGIQNDPGLDGKNIALLPNGDWVTINNVNDDVCGDDTYYVAGNFPDIQYGGRTTPLTAYSQVTPGETYHIRLIIADASDTSFDSAVFLEAGSFSLGTGILDENGVDLGDDLEICGLADYTLYVGVPSGEVSIQWFFNGNPIPGATGNSLTINQSGLYGVEVSDGTCSAEDEINITFGELQTNGTSFILEETDVDGDGFELFDLTEVQPMVLDNPSEANFTYYPTLADAQNQSNQIQNPTSFNASNNTVVYARVSVGEACYAIVKIILRVLDDCINPTPACPGPEFGLNIPFLGDGEIPSSAPPGPNYGCLFNQPYPRFYYFKIAESGNLEFDMSQYTEPDEQGTAIDVDFIVWGPFTEVPCNYEDLQEIVDCSYSASPFEHITIPDAQEGEFYLMMITNYAGSYNMFGYVNLVFDEENSTGSFDCSIITGAKTYGACDDDNDGQVVFDLESIAEEISEGDEFLDVTFYAVEQDAIDDTGQNTIPTAPYTVTTTTSPVEIYAQVKDNVIEEVMSVVTVTLLIYEGVVGAHDADYYTCDIGLDGVEIIDLTTVEVVPNPSLYQFRYYESEQDAIEGNGAFIQDPTNYETTGGTVYVRIETEDGCFAVVEIHIELGDLPVDLGEDFSMCEGQTEIYVQGNFGEGATYVWEMNGEVLDDENGQSLVISGPGTYTVTVTNSDGCMGSDSITVSLEDLDVDLGDDFSMCVGEFEITAHGSFEGLETVTYVWRRNGSIIEGADGPTIIIDQIGTYTVTIESEWGCTGTDTLVVSQGEAPTITDIHVGPDYVIITAEGGELPYTYSLTGVVWQESNQFNYLPPGTYTVYVKSAVGCVSTAQFVVFDIPTMFTPNGDGINDTWNIKGFNIYPGSDITIYDRSGRVVYQAELTSTVIWDGYFKNGKKAPTQDYWYVINVTDGRKFTGHITVKSRGEKN
ncbi:MAG: choice-of-anchor L domain-containing protein [Weeksellaceae bacterium]